MSKHHYLTETIMNSLTTNHNIKFLKYRTEFINDNEHTKEIIQYLYPKADLSKDYYYLNAEEDINNKGIREIDFEILVRTPQFLNDHIRSTKKSREFNAIFQDFQKTLPKMFTTDICDKFIDYLKAQDYTIEFDGYNDLQWGNTDPSGYSILDQEFNYACFFIDNQEYCIIDSENYTPVNNSSPYPQLVVADEEELLINEDSEYIWEDIAFKCNKCGQEWEMLNYRQFVEVHPIQVGQINLDGKLLTNKELIELQRENQIPNENIELIHKNPNSYTLKAVHKGCGGEITNINNWEIKRKFIYKNR